MRWADGVQWPSTACGALCPDLKRYYLVQLGPMHVLLVGEDGVSSAL